MTTKRSDWAVPSLLILLSLVPALAGVARVADLGPGRAVTASNARFHASPVPVVLHIITGIPFSILGALQFVPSLRRRGRDWHRIAGRMLAPCGAIVALSGLWMAHFYPWPPTDGVIVYVERLVFGTAMLLSIVLAMRAIGRREFTAHGDWMTRAYAIGLGAGTQVLTHVPWYLTMDLHPGGIPRATMMGAGWAINLLVAERTIRRRVKGTSAQPRTAVGHGQSALAA